MRGPPPCCVRHCFRDGEAPRSKLAKNRADVVGRLLDTILEGFSVALNNSHQSRR